VSAAVTLRAVRFGWPGTATPIIGIDALEVARGETVLIRGPSGSGKSTLLGLIGGVLMPRSGQIRVLDHDLAALTSAARDRFRAEHLGFVFQQFNLLPYLSVLDNVVLPLNFAKARRQRALAAAGSEAAAAIALLQALDLPDADLHRRRVTELSVGQQQRVAVARALIGAPELLIADEPTSALDTDTRERFLDLLFGALRVNGSTLLFVSHDRGLAPAFDRVIELKALNG
jgi:putative ABC transport system ATP-binding protein